MLLSCIQVWLLLHFGPPHWSRHSDFKILTWNSDSMTHKTLSTDFRIFFSFIRGTDRALLVTFFVSPKGFKWIFFRFLFYYWYILKFSPNKTCGWEWKYNTSTIYYVKIFFLLTKTKFRIQFFYTCLNNYKEIDPKFFFITSISKIWISMPVSRGESSRIHGGMKSLIFTLLWRYHSRILEREIIKNWIHDTDKSNDFDSCIICPQFARVANFALVRNRCFTPLVRNYYITHSFGADCVCGKCRLKN